MNARGERILIFGDSLTHPGQDSDPAIQAITAGSGRAASAPGDLLGSILLEQGAAAVQADAKVGRSALSFFQAEPSAQLLAADQAFAPTKVVIMLGTNDTSRDLVGTEQMLARLRDAYRGMGAEVWAIGPMTYFYSGDALNGPAAAVLAAMQRVFGKDRTIDARPLSADLSTGAGRASDGIHFTSSGAAVLAPRLASALLAAKPNIWPKIALGIGGAVALGAIVWAASRRTGAGPAITPVQGLPLMLAAPKISTKDPATMTAGEINKELDKIDRIDSGITERFINAGRGHERPSEIRNMIDPLALEHNALADRRRDLRFEIERRYGPGAPSRFPMDPKHRGFWKPRKKADDLGGARDALPAPLLKRWKRAIGDYKRAIAAIEAGDAAAREDAQRARERMRKLRDEAAGHAPGSYNDPALHDLDAEESALPKIAEAEERGREARYKSGQVEIKKLREEEREANREHAWMLKGPGSRPKPARVVIYPGDARRPWRARMFDSAGNLRSEVTDHLRTGEASRHYVEDKIKDFWPELPVETSD
jgi:lysophospholipase L1-like esterase